MIQCVLLWMLLAASLAGCGRRGPLVPPEALLPAPVADLRVAQKGERFQVSWSSPAREGGGRPFKGLSGFWLYRREVLPPGEDCEACPGVYQMLTEVDLEYLKDVRRFEDRLFWYDTDVSAGTTYQYKVVSFRKDGTVSRDSNTARRKKVTPPTAPRLTGLFAPTGVVLQWEGGAAPPNGKVIGYNLYRRRADTLSALVPLNGTPEPGSGFEDLRMERGVTYLYSVRTVAEVEGETVESEPSTEITGTLAEP